MRMMAFVSDEFENAVYAVAAKNVEELQKVLKKYQKKESLDDRKGTLTLMWFISTFIKIAWETPIEKEGHKVSDILEDIKQVVMAQEETSVEEGKK